MKISKTELFVLVGLLVLVLIAILAAQRTPTVNPIDGSPKGPRPAMPIEKSSGGSPTSQAVCEESGGIWNACGSACRGALPSTTCIEMCVSYCECLSDDQCPVNLSCQDKIKGTGVCRIKSGS